MKTCLTLLALTLCVHGASRTCDPMLHGAQRDGKADDTAAIQAAIDECAGGTVRIGGGTFLTGPLELKSRVTLQIDKDGVLLGTSERARYRKQDRGMIPLIGASRQTDFRITGEGVIDGAGQSWWKDFREMKKAGKEKEFPRPRLIQFNNCQRVKVQGVTLQNSPMFHLVPSQCEDVEIDKVTILAPADSPNTDGIDPASSRRVRITDCLIDTGDDNIAIKSGKVIPEHPGAGAEDIVITGCTFRHGHGVSIGSETNGGVKNVRVRNCKFQDTTNAIRIKSYRGRGGEVSDIRYSDLTMEGVNPAIVITAYYPKIPATDEAQPVTDTTPWFHDIVIENVRASATKAAGVIVGVPEKPLERIVLRNVKIAAPKSLEVRNAKVEIR